MPKFWMKSMDDEDVSNLHHELSQMREANEKLQHELDQITKSNEKLQDSHFYQKDEIRSLKSDARSKEQEITRLNQQLLEKLQACSKERDIPTDNQNGQIVENLRASIQARDVEIRVMDKEIAQLDQKVRALKEGERSYREEITTLNQKVGLLTERERSYRDELAALNQKVVVLNQKVGVLDQKVGVLQEGERSYREEITTLKQNVQKLEEVAAEESPFVPIGKDVRLRFLEHSRHIGKDKALIKSGNRAAHRGKPVVDAQLFANGDIEDPRVIGKAYEGLYGVSPDMMLKWKDVPEMVEVISFRGSLQCNGQLTGEFREPFDRLKRIAMTMTSSTELRAAFEGKGRVNELAQLYAQLLNCFDRFVAEQRLEPTNSFGRRGSMTNMAGKVSDETLVQ